MALPRELALSDAQVDEIMTNAVDLLTRHPAPAGLPDAERTRVVQPALIIGESTGRAS